MEKNLSMFNKDFFCSMLMAMPEYAVFQQSLTQPNMYRVSYENCWWKHCASEDIHVGEPGSLVVAEYTLKVQNF